MGMWGRRLLLLIEGEVRVERRMVSVTMVGENAGYRYRSGYCFAHKLFSLGGLQKLQSKDIIISIIYPCLLLKSCMVTVLHRTSKTFYRHSSLLNPNFRALEIS